VSALTEALLADLTDDQLADLARRLRPFLSAPAEGEDGWLNTKQAADYLGVSVHGLHRLTAQCAVPFHQSTPGARCWFRRSELDDWRRARRA
jgi:excisionase family DNA binding protein